MSRPALMDRLGAAQTERVVLGLQRRLRTVVDGQGVRVMIDGRSLCSFASNDYLGLAQDARVTQSLQLAAQDWGSGATAAHLLGGHRAPHQQLEEQVADWLGYPRALLFSTGMMANIGVMSTLLTRDDLCVQDRLNHASLLDGARLSGANLLRYPHADVDAAERQLAARPQAAALLASDGVFSMDGDIAKLRELTELCMRQHSLLMIDDAHGVGVIGDQGRGSVSAAGLGVTQVPILMVTLGKALGCAGALVLGSHELIEGLIQFCRHWIYTTALPPALAAAACTAVQIARDEDHRRAQLALLIARFRAGAEQLGLRVLHSQTPIQPIVIGDASRAVQIAGKLEALGFYVPAIRAPTVPEKQARLRITLTAAHQPSEVDALLDALNNCTRAFTP